MGTRTPAHASSGAGIIPHDAGAGIIPYPDKCEVKGAGEYKVEARAHCEKRSHKAQVHPSNYLYEDNKTLRADCPLDTKAVGCYCHSPWRLCGTGTKFDPTNRTCLKKVGLSGSHRRRTKEGNGAMIYAL